MTHGHFLSNGSNIERITLKIGLYVTGNTIEEFPVSITHADVDRSHLLKDSLSLNGLLLAGLEVTTQHENNDDDDDGNVETQHENRQIPRSGESEIERLNRDAVRASTILRIDDGTSAERAKTDTAIKQGATSTLTIHALRNTILIIIIYKTMVSNIQCRNSGRGGKPHLTETVDQHGIDHGIGQTLLLIKYLEPLRMTTVKDVGKSFVSGNPDFIAVTIAHKL